MLTTDPEQIPYFSGRIVADLDDPRFTGRDVALLSRSNVLAYVVTHERAASRYRSLGLTKPYVVIPQGVSADAIDPRRVTNLRFQLRRSDKVVIGYVAAWLLTASDPGGANPLYNIDHLLEIWTDIHQRVPNARLSLIGQPGANVYRLCAGRNDVLLLGRLPYEEVLNQVAAFDIALYPRRAHQAGTRTMKMAEYMTLGVPTVAYDQEVTSDLRASQGGVLVMSPQQFVEAVSALAADPEKRTRMGEAAKRYAGSWRWDNLTTRYEREVFDQYLNDTQSI